MLPCIVQATTVLASLSSLDLWQYILMFHAPEVPGRPRRARDPALPDRALSPKRRQPRGTGDGGEDSDTPGSPGGSSPSFISLTGRTASGRARFRTRRRRTGQAPPASELPELEKSEEDFKREWGISREREVRPWPAGAGKRGRRANWELALPGGVSRGHASSARVCTILQCCCAGAGSGAG